MNLLCILIGIIILFVVYHLSTDAVHNVSLFDKRDQELSGWYETFRLTSLIGILVTSFCTLTGLIWGLWRAAL